MQGQPDYLSVPRRALDVEDYVDILRRHWTWIIGPTFAGLVIAVVVAFLWPDTYLSYAVMRIVPSQVSDRIVPTNFNLHMQDRLATMQQDVTSRSKLIDMIKKFNLYASEQAKRPLEDIVEDMRLSIHIDAVEAKGAQQQANKTTGSAFRLAFSYSNNHDAQKVVTEMVNAFMSQNIVDRRQKSRITTEFLSEEVKTAKASLDSIENELIAFKQRNAGKLPEELQSNLQMQNSYQQQLGAVQEVLNRNQQDKMMLETSLQNLKSQLNNVQVAEEESVAKNTKTETKSDRLAEAEKRVADADGILSAMREQLKPEHPDLKKQIARLETVKQERDRVAAQVAAQAVAEEERTNQQAAVVVAPRKRVNPNDAKNRADVEAQIKTMQARIHGLEL